MDKNSLHFRGTYRNVYEVNRAYPNGGVDGDYVDINGWQHWWNPDRGTWCVNENRDSYWDEVLSTVQNLLFSKACVSESDFPLNPTDEEKRFGYFYNGELYLWTGTNGTVRNGQYRSFGVVQGERGVGVSSIAQTSTSNVDGGKNEITVTLTNGDSYKFFTYNGTGRNKGYYYRTLDELKQAVPSPTVTDWAIVDGSVYVCDEAGVWKDTTYSWKPIKLNPFVTELNKMDMPTSTGYLYWNGQSFGWKTPVVNNGGGNTGGGTSIDLSEYSWWGRKFDPASKMITGEMSAVTSIEFQSTKGETTIRKKLYLDENGDLCFNGNLYATGGVTALGSGGGTSGGSGGSTTGTLYVGSTSNNLGFDGSKNMNLYFGDGLKVEKSDNQITVSATGGGTGGGIRIKRNGSTLKDSNGDVLSCTSINFKYGGNWNSTPILINSDNEISVDLSVVANNGNGGSSSTLYPFTIYNGSSDNDYITYDGSSAAYLKFKSGFSISKVGLGYEISASGSGGSSSRINKIKLFNSGGSSFETVELGSADTIGFMAGDNVSLQAVVKEYTNVIKISANVSSSGGSSGSVDLSNYLTKTEASSTYAVKNHTHSAVAITDFEDAARLVKVNNAKLADKANELNSAVTLWGNNFSGNNSIGTASSRADLKYVKDIYAGDTFDIKAGNNNNSLLKVDGTPNIYVGFGYMANNKASLLLFGNKTTICTSGDDYRYDFKGGVFDVNTNTIHFGPEAGGGKISWDRANNAFKIEGNLYSTGGITALGVSNSATTSNNVDFTFKSVTANTFNVKDSIQISDKLVLNRDHDDVYLASSSIGTYYMYLDGNDKNYYLTSNGDAHFNNLSCDYLDIPGAESFKIVDVNSTTFTIQFQYNGKTYEFTPSDSEVSVS